MGAAQRFRFEFGSVPARRLCARARGKIGTCGQRARFGNSHVCFSLQRARAALGPRGPEPPLEAARRMSTRPSQYLIVEISGSLTKEEAESLHETRMVFTCSACPGCCVRRAAAGTQAIGRTTGFCHSARSGSQTMSGRSHSPQGALFPASRSKLRGRLFDHIVGKPYQRRHTDNQYHGDPVRARPDIDRVDTRGSATRGSAGLRQSCRASGKFRKL